MNNTPLFDGVPNSREVADLPLKSGGRSKSGVLYRSASLQTITSEGLEQLAESPIGIIADLRTVDERNADTDKLPKVRHIETVDIPIAVGNMGRKLMDRFSQGGKPMLSNALAKEGVREMEALLPSVGDMYVNMLKQAGGQLAQVASLVAQVEPDANNAVLIHCTAGKDRTGISTALILDTVGVERDAVVENYASSQEFLAGGWAPKMLAQMEAAGIPLGPKLVAMVTTTPPRAIEKGFAWVDKHYGSSSNYLQQGGLSTAQIDALVEALT